jgi:ATP-dependent Clp protease ATP-binding subunit ClpC
VLDDGIITDGLGRRVDFKNTIIIMTSNVGTRDIRKHGAFGFGEEPREENRYEDMKKTVEDSMKRLFNPEFLNRVDDTIVFHALTKEHIFQIIDISTRKLFAQLGHLGLRIEFTPEAKDFVADKGFDPNFGARPLRRALQSHVEDPLAEEILRGSFPEGSTVLVSVNEAKDGLIFSNPGAPANTPAPPLPPPEEEHPAEEALEGEAK